MAEMKLSELLARTGGTYEGPGDPIIRGVATLQDAQADQVSFLANEKYLDQVEGSGAAAVFVGQEYAGPREAVVRCEDPYFAVRNAVVELHGFRQPEFAGIDDRAAIHPSASLGENVAVGPFVTVGPEVTIGDGCVLYPGAYVGPGCSLGEGCILYANVTLYDGTILGDRVTVHAGSSIGNDGFGYATHGGAHHKIPQVGWVELQDDVEIGACCAIDRGTMGPTVIGAGTKFSNLIAIGHGTTTGKGCLMVAQVGLAGSVSVGDYCVFAGQAGVAGHLSIGDGAQIGAQAGVTNDVPAGTKVWGTPAMPLTHAKRSFGSVARLPEMRKRIRAMEKELAALRDELAGDTAEDSP